MTTMATTHLAFVPAAARTSAIDTPSGFSFNDPYVKAGLAALGGGIVGAFVGSSYGRTGVGAGLGAAAGVGLYLAARSATR